MNGNLIGAVNNPNTSNTSGIWSSEEQKLSLQQNIWPVYYNPPTSIDYLIVAGGGGGPSGGGGGGGAGGFLTANNYAVTTGTYVKTTNFRRAYADSTYSAQGWLAASDTVGSGTGNFFYKYVGLQQSSGGARSIPLPTGGKYYFEMPITAFDNPLIGLARDTNTGGYSFVPSIYLITGGRYGGLGGSDVGAFSVNDVLRIAFDESNSKFFMARNTTWNEDPVTGVGTSISGTGNVRIIIMSGASAGSTCNGTFRKSSENTYTPPSGYTAPSDIVVTSNETRYVITVGAGGSGAGGTNLKGTDGSNSSFFDAGTTITAIGGGAGANPTGSANTGGSGGGAGRAGTTTGASGTSGQGNKGGDISGNSYSGGGGGAGANGQNMVSASQAGAGGVGLQSSIPGVATFYAGGGGGSGNGATGGGSGGNGGGGAGGNGAIGTAGTNNTGGGGGAGAYNGSSFAGGNGGSGVVIIRYPSTFSAIKSDQITGSPTVTTNGGFRIYTFTSSGSFNF